ncbi:hypothetical protein scyTo_0003899 [Scyliorhinus torazame]|uniref:Uncharacterized protein n=1 Tax=Scyliorhinus torazame TaxID=75743 RepID=A0A401PNU2_SCYTO|nr:hypothetical protein [Scyliorhinus torazame]
MIIRCQKHSKSIERSGSLGITFSLSASKGTMAVKMDTSKMFGTYDEADMWPVNLARNGTLLCITPQNLVTKVLSLSLERLVKHCIRSSAKGRNLKKKIRIPN